MSDLAEQSLIADATDAEIDEIIAEFGGDYRQAIRALLHDLTQLAVDSEAAVSKGFVRGRLMPFRNRQAVLTSDQGQPAARPAMTLANMRSLGVRSLDVECTCGHRVVVDVSDIDGAVEVPAMGGRLRCSTCGCRPYLVRPNWMEMRAPGMGAGRLGSADGG